MIVDGGTMKGGGMCENVNLQLEDYFFKSNMTSIEMGGYDVVMGVEWLHIPGLITMDIKELYMSINKEDHKHTLKGLHASSPKIIISCYIGKLLKKGLESLKEIYIGLFEWGAYEKLEENSLNN
jgi:hypothetical protein